MAWITPKTTWVGTDPFTAADWLRIVGNVEYLATAMSIPFTPYTSVTNGETLITSKQRNDVTDMIETLYATLYSSWNRGFVMPRIDYGSAWNSKDLNIIEALIRNLKRQLDGELSSKVDYYCGKEIRCGETVSLGLL